MDVASQSAALICETGESFERPAFDVLGPSFQTALATGVAAYDVALSQALTQLFVNIPAGPWARFSLGISRD